MRQAYISTQLARPAFKYSHLVKAGAHYYLSGMLAQDPQTGQLVGAGAGQEAARILENLQVLMKEFDLEFGHLVMARIFTTEMENFGAINTAWEQVFSAIEVAPPARTSLGVAALPMQARVEMEFTFYRED